jgi:Fe-S-cluster containining protein
MVRDLVVGTIVMRKPQKMPVCSRCGKCCLVQGSGFTMMPEDYGRWRSQGRYDILRYVWLCRVPSDCEGKWDVWIDWIDPQTGENLKHCPFLKRADRGRYTCAIYDTKPRICERFWCERAFGAGKRGMPFHGVNGLKKVFDQVVG